MTGNEAARILKLEAEFDEFGDRLGFLTARHNRLIEPAATRLDALAVLLDIDHLQQHTELGDEVKDLYDRLDELNQRLAELEELHGTLERPAEWVRGNGLRPDDAYNITEKEDKHE